MKPWLSKAAAQLRNQVDDSYRDRQRKSDGWIADDHHKRRGKSDHIPDASANFVVRAIDIDARLSEDKRASAYLADQIRLYAKRNGRIHYVIHLGMIASPILNYKWRRYRGYNLHNHHIHISFRKNQDHNSEFFDIPLLGGKHE